MATIQPSFQMGGAGTWKIKEGAILGWQQTSAGLFKPAKVDFSRNSGGSYVDENGLIQQEYRANWPRLTWQDGKQCLMNEAAFTNLLTYSDDLTQNPVPYQTRGLNTVVFNSDDSPEENGFSSLLTEDTSTGSHDIRFFPSYTTGSTYTFIFAVKSAGRDKIRVNGNSSIGVYDIDLAAQSVTISGTGSNKSGNVTAIANGWYLIKIQGDSATTASDNTFITLRDSSGNTNYTGDGVSGIRLYGLTFGEGDNNSVIKTSGSAVTRAAESVEGLNLGNFLGDSEGGLYVDFLTFSTNAMTVLNISDNSVNNEIFIYTTGAYRFPITAGGVSVLPFSTTGGTHTANQFTKAFGGYKTDDMNLYVDGSSVISDTSGTITGLGLTKLQTKTIAGTALFRGLIHEIKIYDQRPTNAQLQSDTL